MDLTKYLQNCASKLCSKSKSVSELLLLLKPANEDSSSAAAMVTDGHGAGEPMDANDDSGRKSSISTSTTSEISEVTKWSYCTRLTDWLYHVSQGMWNRDGNGVCGMRMECVEREYSRI